MDAYFKRQNSTDIETAIDLVGQVMNAAESRPNALLRRDKLDC